MSATRYCGRLTVRVTYRDPSREDTYGDGTPRHPNGSYRCFVRAPDGTRATVIVGAPAHLDHAVDSPEAFDAAAHAAISFADQDGTVNAGDHADCRRNLDGWLILRSVDGGPDECAECGRRFTARKQDKRPICRRCR